MGWKIIFSPEALDDLGQAVRYIAQDDPEAAEKLGNALIDRVLILKKFPWIGPAYHKRPGVRKLVSPPYIIFYRVLEEKACIEILRYWHSARSEAVIDP
jgi:toxin ParE1/3/4